MHEHDQSQTDKIYRIDPRLPRSLWRYVEGSLGLGFLSASLVSSSGMTGLYHINTLVWAYHTYRIV
jgi:hypothetical protein